MTQHATDHELKDGVERELDWTSDVDGDRIGVAVNDGAITLSGQVASYPEKAAAVNAALRVRGVTAIADEIVVRHRFGPRTDVYRSLVRRPQSSTAPWSYRPSASRRRSTTTRSP